MKETGLMFKAPLVRAILEGRKTQTRRLVKPAPAADQPLQYITTETGLVYARSIERIDFQNPRRIRWESPVGKPGDRIYVRETWADLIAVSPSTGEPMPIGPGERLIEAPTSWTDDKGRTRWHFDGQVIAYRANSDVEFCDGDGFTGEFADKSDMPGWSPSIHMPKEFARIWLEITSVRVERLQDISNEDAIAEGVNRISHGREGNYYSAIRDEQHPKNWNYPDDAFRELWDSTTGRPALPANKNSKRYARVKHWLDTHPDTTSWAANPWVWVIDFKTISTTGRPA